MRITRMVRTRSSSEASRTRAVSASSWPNSFSVTRPRKRSAKRPLRRFSAAACERLAASAPQPTSAMNTGISGAEIRNSSPTIQSTEKAIAAKAMGRMAACTMAGR